MKSSPKIHDPAADEQAALWAAKLEGPPLDPHDRAALDAWLATKPLHRVLLSQYCQFSADLEEQLPLLVATGAVEMPPEKRPRRTSWSLNLLVAGAMAAAAVVAVVVWFAMPATQFENIATAVAQRQSLTLAEGTRVELNAHTSMVIDITRTERRVRLASGEVFFAVTQDRERPFIVETPHGSVKVTGTAFNIRADPAAALHVTVLEGSVLVRPGSARNDSAPAAVSLGAGDRLTADTSGVNVEPLSSRALDDALAWRRGQIVFAGEPLSEALARFGRFHGRGITATDAAGRLKIGGRHSLDDLEGFFTSIEEALSVRVTQELNGTVRVSLRTER